MLLGILENAFLQRNLYMVANREISRCLRQSPLLSHSHAVLSSDVIPDRRSDKAHWGLPDMRGQTDDPSRPPAERRCERSGTKNLGVM